MKKQQKKEEFFVEKQYVDGERYNCPLRLLNNTELEFWLDNPRFYETIRKEFDTDKITQEDIYTFYTSPKVSMQRDLLANIVNDGGVNERLIVQKNPETKKFTVIEGNTRLACIRQILAQDLIKDFPRDVEVMELPESLSKEKVTYIVGRYHIVGKKDWSSHESNAYVYRKYIEVKHSNSEKSKTKLIDMLAKQFGSKTAQIKRAVKSFEFLEKHNLRESDLGSRKYSYFEMYANSAVIQKTAKEINDPELAEIQGVKVETHNAMDKMFIKHVQRDDCPKTVDIRDWLIAVCNSADGGRIDPLKLLIEEDASISDAVKTIDSGREDVIAFFNKIHQKLKGAAIETKKIKQELDADKVFRKKIKYIHNFLGLQLDLPTATGKIRSEGRRGKAKFDPEKVATWKQCTMLATILSKLPSRPNSCQFNRLQGYFLNEMNEKRLTNLKVNEIKEFAEKEKEVPQDIIDAIEEYLETK